LLDTDISIKKTGGFMNIPTSDCHWNSIDSSVGMKKININTFLIPQFTYFGDVQGKCVGYVVRTVTRTQ